ncbi:hypothetical protein [Aneurinibacillus tyrosinisolvens]|uniref:hypothetical protein n=1 Tax=Aneurinibacillus tyrosinisolvens TaxID=1443435 RepID=UPI00063F93C9|nr:hypothetical protein [Aneurinibacillus tyrosinisolvens]
MVKRRVRKVAINSLIVIGLMYGTALGVSKAAETKPDLKKFDIIGRLKAINGNNESLSKTNMEIVRNMKAVDEQVGKTGQVAARLKDVNGGLGKQENTLNALIPVTADQVTLSTNLKGLSVTINGNMKTISNVSMKQDQELKRMNRVVQDARSKLESVMKGNEAINQKLGTAADKTRQIEQSIP